MPDKIFLAKSSKYFSLNDLIVLSNADSYFIPLCFVVTVECCSFVKKVPVRVTIII